MKPLKVERWGQMWKMREICLELLILGSDWYPMARYLGRITESVCDAVEGMLCTISCLYHQRLLGDRAAVM